MPSYRHLLQRDLERLAAFLVEHTCGEPGAAAESPEGAK
jgi:hypothetical protein